MPTATADSRRIQYEKVSGSAAKSSGSAAGKKSSGSAAGRYIQYSGSAAGKKSSGSAAGGYIQSTAAAPLEQKVAAPLGDAK